VYDRIFEMLLRSVAFALIRKLTTGTNKQAELTVKYVSMYDTVEHCKLNEKISF